MASKKTAPTDEELSAMFAGIGDDDETSALASSTVLDPSGATSQPTTTTNTNTKVTPASTEADDDDPLAELATLAAAPRISTSSRPQTPSRFVRDNAGIVKSRAADVYTPTTPASRRSSEEKEKDAYSNESESRGFSSYVQPTTAPQLEPQQSSPPKRGGWWGGLSSLATAAVTQAQAAVKEIQKNEEAQKWAEQVKENVGALKGLDLRDLRSRALPTFNNILHQLAPPISQHERLQIHITHDLNGYPALDPLVYQTFSRVMAQVEGGDLLVIQRGSESTHRRISDVAYDGGLGGTNTGWSDGPWWRDHHAPRSINAVRGLVEGTRLVRVSAETYSTEFYSSRGGLEEAAKRATTEISKDNPVRSSDVFLAIQAISYTEPNDLFSSGQTSGKDEQTGIVVEESHTPVEMIAFAVYLHDAIHNIEFSTISQAVPQQWTEWLDAQPDRLAGDDVEAVENDNTVLPQSILEIIESGGVDPRAWVAEWIEEVLMTAVSIVAQRYVARRMGVGEGGIGRGKRREASLERGAGEAARAI